jgi:hypothetical protein
MSDQNGGGNGVIGLMVFVKCDDGKTGVIPLTAKQQEKLFGYITHTLYGGKVTIGFPELQPEPPEIVMPGLFS